MPRLTLASGSPVPSAGNLSHQQDDRAALTIATNRTPTDLDRHTAYDAGSNIVLHPMHETLIRLKPGTTDQYLPLLAESWETNPDRTVWTFRLRPEVRFHDGTPCDAEAVRASFGRALSLGFGPATVISRFVQDVAQITTPDARTVVFALQQHGLQFEAMLASPTVAIANAKLAIQHEVDGDLGHAWAQTTSDGMGTGPYRITRFDIAEGIVFERFDDYWQGWEGDHFDRVLVRVVAETETRRQMVERGEADVVDTISSEALDSLAANPDLVVDLRYGLTVRYIILNASGPLASPAARQALCWAFPYDDVIEGVYEGHAKRAVGPVAELCNGFAPGTFIYQTDLEQARRSLAEAGVAAGTKLSIVLPQGVAMGETIAQLFGANLDQIGLELEIQYVDFATLVNIYYGEMPAEERPNLMPAFWSPDYNDGWNHLWPQVSSEAWRSGNAGHYANPQVDDLLAEARDAADDTTYANALGAIQQIVTRDDPVAIYYAQDQWSTVLRRSVSGFVPNAVSPQLYDFYALGRMQAPD